MARDLIMDNSGDLMVTNLGDIRLTNDNEDLVQTAIHNMRTIYQELENDLTRGNLIFTRRIRLSETGLQQVEFDCKNAILQDSRIADATLSIERSEDDAYTCVIRFKLKTQNGDIIDGESSLSMSE